MSRPYPTAAFASAKRMNILNAGSGRFRSARLEQVFTTPTAKKQNQQSVPDGFQGAVNIEHHAPNPASLKGGGILGE